MSETVRLPIIALVGRTNVGKSTLFNRLTEQREALVSAVPGTTRDRQEGEVLWQGLSFTLVDTGGLDVSPNNPIEQETVRQAQQAIRHANLVLFVVDVQSGPLPQDREIARALKRSGKPVLVVGNKAESPSKRASVHAPEWQLAGLPEPIPVSALRGTGTGDLLDDVYRVLRRSGSPPAASVQHAAVRVAVIGKPNAGKSSLLNAILKEERFIASPIAHTTRQPIDTLITWENQPYLLVDTAGMRKRGKSRKAGGLEEEGVERTVETLRRTDVALFVLDATEPLTTQDRTLAGLLEKSRVGVALVVNKWDLVEGKTIESVPAFIEYVYHAFPFLTWAPLVFTSAKTGQRTEKLLPLARKIQAARLTEIPPEALDAFLKEAIRHRGPIRGKGPQPPKVLGISQVGTAPPTFVVTLRAKRTDVISPSYLRYLENRLHEKIDLEGTPVRVLARIPTLGAAKPTA